MDANVVLTNLDAHRVAVRNRMGEYAILDIIKGGLPEVGDVLSGGMTSRGYSRVANLTQRLLLHVDVLATGEKVAHKAKNVLRRPSTSS